MSAAAALHDSHVTAWRDWRHAHARQFLARLDQRDLHLTEIAEQSEREILKAFARQRQEAVS